MKLAEAFVEILADDKTDETFRSVEGKTKGFVGNLSSSLLTLGTGAVLAGAVAAAGAVTAIGVSAFNSASDVQGATNMLKTQLGITEADATRLGEVLKNVYGNNFGGSIAEVGQAIGIAGQQFRDFGTMAESEIQGAVESAFALQDAFGVDMNQSMNAANALMTNFGMSSKEAFDFIAAGMQQGLNSSGDFLDSIGEYSTQFSNGGATAGQFFSVMQTGLGAGMLGTDKAADMFKEFVVRIQDGSKTTTESLTAIGLDADAMAAGFADGSLTAAQAFEMVQTALKETDDQNVQFQAGVGLLGTQFEDLGVSAALGVNMAATSMGDLAGAGDSLNAQYDSLGSMMEGVWRQVQMSLEPIGAVLLDLANRLMPIIMVAFGWFETNVVPMIEAAAEAFGEFIDTLIGIIPGVVPAFKELLTLFTGIATGIDPFEEGLINVRELLGELGMSTAGAEKVAEVFFQIAEAAQKVIDPIAKWVAENIKLQDVLVPLGILLAAVLLPIIGSFIAAIGGLVAAAAPVIAVFAALVLAAAVLRMAWEQNFAGIQEFVGNLWTAIQTAFDGIKQIFEGDVKGGLETLKGAFGDAFAAIVELVKNLGSEIYTAMAAVWDAIVDWVGDQDWPKIGSDIIEFIVESLEAFNDYAAGVLVGWYEAFVDWVGDQDWPKIGSDIIEFIVESLEAFNDYAAGVLVGWYQAFVDWVSGIDWGQIGRDIIAFIIEALTTFDDYVSGVLAGWYQAFVDWVSGIDWKQVGYDIVTFILEGLYFFVVEVPKKLAEWFQAFVTWVDGVPWADIATSIITAIVTGLSGFIDSVRSTLDGWFNDTKSYVGGMDWAAIGQSIIDGIKNFISGSTAIKDALKNMAQGAWDAIVAFWESRSPSQRMARLGSWIMEGLAIGIAQTAGKPAAAMNDAIGDFDDAAMSKLAETVAAMSQGIGAAIAALSSLIGTNIDAGAAKSKIEELKDFLNWAIRGFIVMFWRFYEDTKGLENTLNRLPVIVEAVTAVSGAIQDSVSAIASLADLVIPTGLNSKLEQLKDFVTQAAWMFADVAEGMTGELADAIGAFTDAAGSVFGIIEDAIEAVAALSSVDFGQIVQGWTLAGQMEIFRNIVRTIVRLFVEGGLVMSEELSKAVQNFADAADAVFGLMEGAIAAITALRDYVPLNTWNATAYAGLLNIVGWTKAFVAQFNLVAGIISAEGTAAVTNFADAANAVFSLMEGAIEAITALRDYVPLNTWNATAYTGLVNIVGWVKAFVVEFNKVADIISTEGTAAVTNFAEAAGAIVGLIGPAIEAIGALASFAPVQNLQSQVEAFASAMKTAVSNLAAALVDIANQLGESLAAAVGIATSVTSILAVVQPAVESLAALATFQAVANLHEQVSVFTEQFKLATQALTDALIFLKGQIGDKVPIAAEIAAAIGNIFSSVQAAVESLAAIAAAKMADTKPQMDYLMQQATLIATALTSSSATLNGTVVQAAQAFAANIAIMVAYVQQALEAIRALLASNTPGSLQTILDQMAAAMANKMTEAWNKIAQITQQGGNEIVRIAREIAQDVVKAFDLNWGDVGYKLAQGIADGLRRGASLIKKAAEESARSALASAQAALGIKSPSRLAAQEIGVPFVQGIAEGMRDYGPVRSAINSLVNVSMPQMMPVMAGGPETITIHIHGRVEDETLTVSRGPGGVLTTARSRGVF